jgi:cysteine desulfurase
MGITNRIYLDNAATTRLAPEVLEAMLPYLTEKFGNPSSIYSYGRESRLAIENARKTVANLLNAHPAEIFFTSGGTESSNTAIRASIKDLGCTHIITSPLEHHATLHTVLDLQQKSNVVVSYVSILPDGHIDLSSLEALVSKTQGKCLVTLSHANNEIGNITNLHAAGSICRKHHAVFHSDTVQTIGHYPFDLRHTPVDFITGSGHKFHGPKGVGILYINEKIRISPLLQGGAQERNMRAGTENVYGIVGFARALELAMKGYEEDSRYILSLKTYMAERLKESISGVSFNGDAFGNSLYTVLNVSLPRTQKSEMILFNLDIQHICASGGSACASGVDLGSHVIRAITDNPDQVAVRFSFSKYNTKEEIDQVVEKLKQMI